MLRILSQRAALTDDSYRMMSEWFSLFSDMVNAINKRTFTASATQASLTGTTDETTEVTTNIKVGNYGTLNLFCALSSTSNANAKTARVKLSGTTIATVALTNNTAAQSFAITLVGRGASSQYVATVLQNNCTVTAGAATVDLSGTVPFTITLQLATGTDTVSVESYTLEVETA